MEAIIPALVHHKSKSLETCNGALISLLPPPMTGKNSPAATIRPTRHKKNPTKHSTTTSFGGEDVSNASKSKSSADDEMMNL